MDLPSSPPTEEVAAEDLDVLGPLVFSGMRQPDIVGVCPSMILRYRRTVAIRNAS